MNKILTAPYVEQKTHWPQTGHHILAQYDEESIIVYQAYNRSIGHFAARHGYFGGSHFSFERMSWIKTNFLWMMYRNGWSQKENQEVTLAIRLRRSAFDSLLAAAVPSSYRADVFPSQEDWKKAVASSEVRLQWDPDHSPTGHKQERRALQLGLRGSTLQSYARDWILEIEDISDFVAEQRPYARTNNDARLLTPREEVYLNNNLRQTYPSR
ncbi:DUF4291 domain-containing protein [Dictyobacter kobayashii]|uniref:DUF4291 domain-containing protein n=1 Tax=Dictyobacter kobayashii TaxID=2014872 RepID=A0A402AJ76_9CHLR|nr:DUF4291 domain-containing protein [Dictyobacter kobayashii]GCE19114.1 hypothetical protein KDK_29140 [Dictyobacter kobayashii]